MTIDKLQRQKRFGWYHFILLFFAIISVAPFYLVVVNSMKSHIKIVVNPINLPAAFNITNFAMAWKWGEFAKGFLNSITLTGTTIVVILFCSSTMAYAMAKNRIKAIPYLIVYFMVAMTIPIQLFMFSLLSALQ